jgi:hypothetical protein
VQTSASLVIDGAASAEVFHHVESLDRYPAWMRIVHRVEPLAPDEGRPAWRVELRARVGPFARSKRLRMVRTALEPGRRVRFERLEDDGRTHAAWVLEATVDEVAEGARLTTELAYTGSLWTGSVLPRVLDHEIEHGREALRRLVTVEPTR